MIDEYFRDERNGHYVLILNPKMKVIFSRDSWTQVDWSIRNALRGHPLAQWLHGFYSSHAVQYALKIQTLHRLCGSEAGANAKTEAGRHKALLDWRDDSLIPALKALETASGQVGQMFAWEISANNKVVAKRTLSASQQKFMRVRKAEHRKHRGREYERAGGENPNGGG